MSELDETLNRRRQRSEVAGAVFEAASRGQEADAIWGQHAEGQFTPRGSKQEPAGFHDPPPVKGKGKGKRIAGGGGADIARMDSPEGLRNRAPPERRSSLARMASPRRQALEPRGHEELTEFEAAGPPALQLPAEAAEAQREPDLPHGDEAQTPMQQRDSEMSRATVDASTFSIVPPTAPASPTLSPRNAPTPSEARSLVPPAPRTPLGATSNGGTTISPKSSLTSEGGWAPTPEATGLRPPVGPVLAEDKPSMSSSSYFRPYVRHTDPAPAPPPAPAPVPATTASFDACAQPFPKAKEAVLQKKLRDASGEVRMVCESVSAALAKPRMHPAELQEIVKSAEGVRASSRLTDTELECIGWPTKVLQQMREIIGHVEHWQQCEDEAKRAIADGSDPLPVVVKTLEGILVAWSRLSTVTLGPLHVDPGLERRAASTIPLVAALLDQIMALVRRKPDVFLMRQLEALLRHSVAQHPLKDLGVTTLFKQALHELDESVQGLPLGNVSGNGVYLAAPEVVWRAVVDGDAATIARIIHQGGLVSGRTCDPKGHSILWDAIAFNNPEVALLLMRSFPPDMPYGVDLGELHSRNGNSLLHLVSGLPVFSPLAEGVFAMIFERTPEALRLHHNARGQTFLHIAAGRLHNVVLKFATVRGLSSLFNVPDASGWTPRAILVQRLTELNVACELPAARDLSGARPPPWCALAALQPPTPGSRPPFADAAIEVCDERRGQVELHAHCVILAGCSPVLNKALKAAARSMQLERDSDESGSTGAPSPVKIPLDPKTCSSLDVALFALRFLYTGETDCSFRGDTRLMLQLVRLSGACALPVPLRSWALHALLHSLDNSTSGEEVVALMREARELDMEPSDQCFVARRIFGSDAAWQAIDEERRSEVIDMALDALEPFVAEATRGIPKMGAPVQAPLSSGPLGGPMGSGPLGHGAPMAGAMGSGPLGPSAPPGSGPLGPGAPMGSGLLGPGAPMGSGPLGAPMGSGLLGPGAPWGSGPPGRCAPLGSGLLGGGLEGGGVWGGGALPPIQEAPLAMAQAVPSGSWW